MKKTRLFLLGAVLFSATLFAQTTYYVSSSQGNDNNNGTSQSSPWKTLSKVNSFNFQPGAKILFRKGDSWIGSASLNVSKNGNSSNPITFSSYGTGALPVIQRTGSATTVVISGNYNIVENLRILKSLSYHLGVQIWGSNNTIQDCEVLGDSTYAGDIQIEGIGLQGDNLVVRRCIVRYFTLNIVGYADENGAQRKFIIENNISSDTRPLPSDKPDVFGIGIRFPLGNTGTNGSIVRGNLIYNFSVAGISTRTGGLIIEHNEIHSVQQGASGANGLYAIHLGGGTANPTQSSFSIARYNKIHDLEVTIGGAGIVIASSDIEVYGNLLYNIDFEGIEVDGAGTGPKTGIKIWNNTIVNAARDNYSANGAIRLNSGVGNDIDIANNIVHGVTTGLNFNSNLGIITTRNNLFVANNNSIGSGTTHVQLNNIGPSANPQFVNPSANNYHLQQNSPAVDAGIIVGLNYDLDSNLVPINLIPDIGAYEFGSSSGSNSVKLNTKIFLEGAFNSGSMSTTLLTGGHIPLNQSYNVSPWNYNGTETVASVPTGVVDWVLIELRSGTAASTLVARRAALIKSNGTVTDLDGSSNVNFNSVSQGNYYVVIRHRNHLDIMSSNTVSLSSSPSLYDFTNASNKAYGNEPQKNLGDGKWGLYAGDGDLNATVNVIDYGTVGNNLFETGYKYGDLDMNGVINVIDYGRTNQNLFRISQVPN
jgi:hypothetical protein